MIMRPWWVLALCYGCGGEETIQLQPQLSDIQSAIFGPACATGGCHDAESAAGELDLSTAPRSHRAMVGVRSKNRVAKENGWLMVKPGEPERSFLLRKLDGPGLGEGDPMPSETQMLNPYYRDLIADWIVQGAQP